jgi:hypothetical protein
VNQTTRPPIKPETFAMIERLIGFDTTSRDSNLGLIGMCTMQNKRDAPGVLFTSI